MTYALKAISDEGKELLAKSHYETEELFELARAREWRITDSDRQDAAPGRETLLFCRKDKPIARFSVDLAKTAYRAVSQLPGSARLFPANS